MKKRLFCLFLCLCLFTGLFAGTGAVAFAAGDTITVTLERGDTVGSLCKKLGVDFQANYEWITKTNNIGNYSKLAVGRTIVLPAPGTVLTYVAPVNTTAQNTAQTVAQQTVNVATIQYTIKPGDYLLKVCKDLGIDYAANQEWIKRANNLTNLDALKVGATLTLPAPGTYPALNSIPGAANTTATGATVANGGTGVDMAAANAAIAAKLLPGDYVCYFLITHVVSSGETLFNICNSYGVKLDTVQALNGIANAARIGVGQKIYIPSTSVPPSGGFVMVVGHKVVSGDTVMGICKSYGIDYKASLDQIKSLNNKDNLNSIKVGQTLLIPVSGTVSIGVGNTVVNNTGTLPNGTMTQGTTTQGTAQGTTTTTTTVPNANANQAYYTLNQNGAANGTYALTVNGQAVNSANAGQVVHIVASPDHYFSLDTVSVVQLANNAQIAVDANLNFLMPAGDVRVTVTFKYDETKLPHSISNFSDSQLYVTPVVNGYTKYSAEAGQTVRLMFETMPAGKFISYICVSTVVPASLAAVSTGQIDASTIIPVNTGDYSFTMPAANVYITVLLGG